MSIAAATFGKAVSRGGVKPFELKGRPSKQPARARQAPAQREPVADRLSGFLAGPPVQIGRAHV